MMKNVLLSIILIAIATLAIAAQDTQPQAQPEQQRPGNLLQQLGLSPDQLLQVRQLNQQRKPQMEEAQRRMREANKALDAAIYADNVDDNDVRAKLEEVQHAQAELARVRYTNELAIRKILTPDQLIRFRDMRQKFEMARENMQQRRQERRQNGLGPGQRDPSKQGMRRMLRDGRQQTKPQQTPAQPKPSN
ncbi:MAG TPA: periplasmic heavy metal sensor [Pyrinomonadaceae bacterium]|nr:periplasmic heavy metal sensor [Pyrinomonadaceae bacterium]